MRCVSLIAILAMLSGCTPPKPDPAAEMAAVKQAIDAANARFVDAFRKGDVPGTAVNYTDDAIIMMPGEPAWHGRAAISKGFAGFIAQVSPTSFSFKTDGVVLSGDLAVESGTAEWTMQPKKGKPFVDKSKYVTVW